MSPHPMTELMKKLEAKGFGDFDSLFWATKLYDVSDGFFVKVLAATPMFGEGGTQMHWVPREPAALEWTRRDPAVVRQAMRAIEVRISVHHFIAHDLFRINAGDRT